jgi:hypothetical protein
VADCHFLRDTKRWGNFVTPRVNANPRRERRPLLDACDRNTTHAASIKIDCPGERVEICFETSPKQESTFARGLCWHGGPPGSRTLLPNQCCTCSAAYTKLAPWVLEPAFVDPSNRANSGAIVPSSEALAPSLFQASGTLPNRSFDLPHARLRKEPMMAFARATAAVAA